ncbi:carbohydrate porin [Acidipila sp. 4G-K13]|uniref:Porin n=2 Tax=Paracidobacterium acidisoli TaxID=2303751 RepID=A0A372ISV0_9BACT|nr:carbohydrate porin [Paracidobacterium acidisoli]
MPQNAQGTPASWERASFYKIASLYQAQDFGTQPRPDAATSSERVSPEQPADTNEVTLFPHSQTAPWWVSGQANIIFQAHPGFHSAYQGPNSLRNAGEYKTSLVGTLFLGYQPHHNLRYNTDFIVDFESAGGRGLSEALGLAGFTNLDVVRNPNLGSTPYLARGIIHQTIGLTDRMTDAERGYFSLAAKVPERRFEFRIGKMSLPDAFDLNSIGSDSHLQFMNWTIDNNGAWDYAADTRGYTVGAMLEYDDKDWSARYGLFAMPVVANGIDLDWAFSRARGQNIEFELRRSVLPGRKGVTRILGYVNNAHMGSYREAVEAYLAGVDSTPTITAHEHFGAVKYGFTWNNEQELTQNLRVYSRFGWNEGQHESFAYTEVDQTVAFGGDYAGAGWHRPNDKIGAAFVSNAIKRDHQNYLRYGGLGFLLGDGRLNYGRENILESYYTYHAWKGLFFSLDVQHVDNPGYNRDRGPVWVESVRTHVDF